MLEAQWGLWVFLSLWDSILNPIFTDGSIELSTMNFRSIWKQNDSVWFDENCVVFPLSWKQRSLMFERNAFKISSKFTAQSTLMRKRYEAPEFALYNPGSTKNIWWEKDAHNPLKPYILQHSSIRQNCSDRQKGQRLVYMAPGDTCTSISERDTAPGRIEFNWHAVARM